MEKALGKNQSYCREINFELVIDLLRKEPRSATQLSDILKLSNATMSSIIRNLLSLGMIDIAKSASVKGSGRKQVFYTLNEKFGLILVVNMSRYKADVSITNIKEESIASSVLPIEGINEESTNLVIQKASELLDECQSEAPLKNIIISISGLVKDKTEGSEKHFVQAAFENHFHNVPTYLTNDGNLITYGELSKGVFAKEDNGIMVLIDYGIGGSFVVGKTLFRGDNGYSGEIGRIPCEYNGKLDYIENVASLKALLDRAKSILKKPVEMNELFNLYKSNKGIHDMVIESAHMIGKALKSLVDVTDISNLVIAGRAVEFGDDYLKAIRKETAETMQESNVVFSPLGEKGQMIGGAFIGVDYILKKSFEK